MVDCEMAEKSEAPAGEVAQGKPNRPFHKMSESKRLRKKVQTCLHKWRNILGENQRWQRQRDLHNEYGSKAFKKVVANMGSNFTLLFSTYRTFYSSVSSYYCRMREMK